MLDTHTDKAVPNLDRPWYKRHVTRDIFRPARNMFKDPSPIYADLVLPIKAEAGDFD